MSFCKKCNGWLTKTHRCPPVWECRAAGDDWIKEVRGIDAGDAAEEFAESLNDGDFVEVQEVEVRVPGAAKWMKFRVRAEASVDYYAEEL